MDSVDFCLLFYVIKDFFKGKYCLYLLGESESKSPPELSDPAGDRGGL